MRRLVLATGSTGVATTLTLAIYMAGLGLGGLWGGRRPWRRPPRGYGLLELGLAGWALAFPGLLWLCSPAWSWGGPPWLSWSAALLLLPPSFLAGATLPAIASSGRLRISSWVPEARRFAESIFCMAWEVSTTIRRSISGAASTEGHWPISRQDNITLNASFVQFKAQV